MTTKNKRVAPVVLAALLMSPVTLLADESENIIKYRQAMMKAIGGHMSASSLIVRGKISRMPELKMHAHGLKTLAADIPALFPEDSDFGETSAKAEVWEKRDDFLKAAETAKQSIADFVAAVDSGNDDAIAAGFKEVGKGCKGCHKEFREKDE
jgi:cytochrome c556